MSNRSGHGTGKLTARSGRVAGGGTERRLPLQAGTDTVRRRQLSLSHEETVRLLHALTRLSDHYADLAVECNYVDEKAELERERDACKVLHGKILNVPMRARR